MAITILLSNYLLKFLVGPYLTAAAFTFPVVYLIIDCANRFYGKIKAYKVMLWGVALGIAGSFLVAIGDQIYGTQIISTRIAIASLVAFTVSQVLNVAIFDKLRDLTMWKTPVISSGMGSIIDTFIFFFIAFSALTFSLVPDGNDWALAPVTHLGIEMPTWAVMAAADLLVKFCMIVVLLPPYLGIVRLVYQAR